MKLLDSLPALHIWGHTARPDKNDPIAAALIALANRHWGRFAVPLSNTPLPFKDAAYLSDAF